MKVALLYPSWTGGYGIFRHFAKRGSIFTPLNLALLGAIGEQHGHEMHIVDGEAENLSLTELIDRALSLNPDIIGLTAYSPFFHINKALAEGLKERNSEIPIMVGGPHITIMKEKSMFPAFDYGFTGEAEISFPQFLEQYEKGGDISQVKGIMYRKDGEIVSTGEPEWIKATRDGPGRYPLDQLPFPGRHLLKMEKYRLGTLHGRFNFSSIQTMRGCPWKCIFCASAALNTTRVIKRSPRSVVDELKEVVSKYGIKYFYIIDDVLTLDKKHIVDICDLIEEEKLDIKFEGMTRANLLEEDVLAKMAHAGLIRLSFGLETVDPEMRETMGKKVPLEAYVNANRLCSKYGVEAMNSMMIGLPGETRETVKASLDFLRKSRDIKQANFAIAVPYPGTEFHEMAQNKEKGLQLMTEDFSKYRRYGSAVTTVNKLTPEDLVELQNDGFVSIYSAPWRWRPMIQKYGALGGLLMLVRLANLVTRKFFKTRRPILIHPGLLSPTPKDL
jgi:radical SAM superfamily enzyme YgiQ (UPF0313 family)